MSITFNPFTGSLAPAGRKGKDGYVFDTAKAQGNITSLSQTLLDPAVGGNAGKWYVSTVAGTSTGTNWTGTVIGIGNYLVISGGAYVVVKNAAISSGPVFYCETEDEAGILDAITRVRAAGSGTIMLPNREITITAPLPVESGLYYQGVLPKLNFGGIPDLYNQRPVGGVGNGTVLRGDGTFNIFEGNTVDRTAVYGSTEAFADAGISGFGIDSVAIIGGLNGIRVGARAMPGLFYSELRNVFVYDCEQWGVWLENFQHCIVSNLQVFDNKVGQIAWVMSAGIVLSPGNSHFDSVYAAARGTDGGKALRNSRGICLWAFTSGIYGSQNTSFLQSTKFGTTPLGGGDRPFGTGIAGSTTNGSANITVPDGTEFSVDMPVSFAATAAGFTAKKIYFVTSISGNTITLSLTVRGLPINATATTTITIGGSGFAPLELVGYVSRETVAAQTPSSNAVTGTGTGPLRDFITGQACVVTTTGTIPGLTPGAQYYIIKTGADTYKFATSFTNAIAGTAITLSSAWTGTATITGTAQVGGFSLEGVDIEAGGTAGLVLQNTTGKVNLDASSPGNTGGNDAVFVQLIAARNARGSVHSLNPATWDSDRSFEITGRLIPRNSDGNMPVGFISDDTSFWGINLDPTATASTTAIGSLSLRNMLTGVGGSFLLPGVSTAQKVAWTASSSVTVNNFNADHIFCDGGGTATLPTVDNTLDSDGNPATPNNLGRTWTIHNVSTSPMTLNTSSSQVFDNTGGRTSTTIAALQAVTVTATRNSSGILQWSLWNRTPTTLQPQLSYAATVTPDCTRSHGILIGPVTADMTVANPSGSTVVFPQFLLVEIILDSFASETRNITWGAQYKFPVAFVQPTVSTHANARTVVMFARFGGGWMAIGSNAWFT